MDSAATPATACARATTSICPSTLGALKPTFCAPSLLMAEPSTTAWIWSPSASASERRLRTTTPTPLPMTVPSPPSSNARQRPSGENTPCPAT
jgi:hypothetical protein